MTCVATQSLQLCACYLPIIPGYFLFADNDTLFVSFASQQNCISCRSASKGRCNCFFTVGDAEKINILPFPNRFRTLSNRTQDCLAIFLARVLISNNEKIGHLCRNAPHNRTFL